MIADVARICKQGGRPVNQDCLETFEGGGRMCLTACDGLGAYAGSGEASEICSAYITRAFARHAGNVTADAVTEFFRGAHESIVTAKSLDSSLGSSCTTAACVFADDADTLIAHIGDTRVYVFENGKIAMRTADHSVAQLAVERGRIDAEEIRFHKHQNKLTRVVGGKFFVLPDFCALGRAAVSGDAFLLCTDGFWEYVTSAEMEEDIASSQKPAEALGKMEQRLLAAAPAGNDNYSAILAFVK